LVQVTNLSRDWARAGVDVPLPADVDLGEVGRVLREVCAAAWRDPQTAQLLLDEPVVSGVENLTTDHLNVRLVARTRPGAQGEVTRYLRARVLAVLRANRWQTPVTPDRRATTSSPQSVGDSAPSGGAPAGAGAAKPDRGRGVPGGP
jgi:small conductance mechanosensitive channel